MLAQPKDEYIRDATIQRFEYTYELTWKMLKRYLYYVAGVEEYQIKNIVRIAAQQHLIDDVNPWFAYLKARNLTSQTYNAAVAEETYNVAKQFLPNVKTLLINLEKAIDENSADK